MVGERLVDIGNEYDGTVDVIAHSMGGLNSRWCIEKQDGAQYVDELITFGTPHWGTYNAYLRALTEGSRDLQPGGDALTELNDGTLTTGVEYTALWSSDNEVITPSEYAQLPSPEVRSVSVARTINSGFQEHGQLVYLLRGENTAHQGGRESDMVLDSRRRWLAGTQTLSTRPFGRDITVFATSHPVDCRGMWTALHPCSRCPTSPVKRCDWGRHGTARFDRLGESCVEKPRGDDSLADGSTGDGATGCSHQRVETRPADAGRGGSEIKPGRPGSPLWEGSPAVHGGRGRHDRSVFDQYYELLG